MLFAIKNFLKKKSVNQIVHSIDLVKSSHRRPQKMKMGNGNRNKERKKKEKVKANDRPQMAKLTKKES